LGVHVVALGASVLAAFIILQLIPLMETCTIMLRSNCCWE